MTEESYEQLDELFKEIRLGLAKVRQSDPKTVDDLKSLLTQLEFWVESLVTDSLKLKSLEGLLQKTTELAKRLREGLDRGDGDPGHSTVTGTSQSPGEDLRQATSKQ